MSLISFDRFKRGVITIRFYCLDTDLSHFPIYTFKVGAVEQSFYAIKVFKRNWVKITIFLV